MRVLTAEEAAQHLTSKQMWDELGKRFDRDPATMRQLAVKVAKPHGYRIIKGYTQRFWSQDQLAGLLVHFIKHPPVGRGRPAGKERGSHEF